MKTNNKFLLVLIGFVTGIALSILFMGNNTNADEETHINTSDKETHSELIESEEKDEDLVKLSEAEISELGIELKKVTPNYITTSLDLSGEIKPDPRNVYDIIPRFQGIVKEIYKKIGDKVSKGDILAKIESNESLSDYNLVSMISGTIVDMHITKGELTNTEKESFMIVDLKNVWADFAVYQNDISKVKLGQKISIKIGNKTVLGVISYLSPTIDKETRTLVARAILDNKNDELKPGMFITGKVSIGKKKVNIAVEQNAIQFFENKNVVFIKTEKGFKPEPVVLGKGDNKFIEIKSGLKLNSIYVSKGSFNIKAELEKNSFGGGHSH